MFSPPLVGQSERAEKSPHQARIRRGKIGFPYLSYHRYDRTGSARPLLRSLWGEGRKRRRSEETRKE
jgi:hypothetical protein